MGNRGVFNYVFRLYSINLYVVLSVELTTIISLRLLLYYKKINNTFDIKK
jgi:hypothetical protein